MTQHVIDSSATLAALLALCGACATPSPPAPAIGATPTEPSAAAAGQHHAGAIDWHPWDEASFATARTEGRMLLVTVVTQWCHWCHVMDTKTWGDPAIAALIADRFVAIRVDADARPDLAERYADWGWPAIALLTPDAQPVTEWKGYQEARRFESELVGYAQDQDAGRTLARKAAVVDTATKPLAAIRDFTRAQLDRFYDPVEGGWGKPQKYPRWAPVAAGLFAGVVHQDTARLAEVTRTLDGELALIDPVDGGMFQYSLQGVWTAPHYEKLAEIQGPAMENLVDGFGATNDVRYLHGARAIARYVRTVLRRDDGAFFANQDADVGTRGDVAPMLGVNWYALPGRAERAARGEPFIDRHVYASHNGRLIAGLARLGQLTADQQAIDDAVTAADVILARHVVGDGFSHDEGHVDDAVLHLADQVAMGHALLTLAEATGQRRFRQLASRTAHFITSTLEDPAGGGYFAHTPVAGDVGVFAERRKPFKGNGEAIAFILKVGRLDEDTALTSSAERALQAFAVEGVVKEEFRAVGEMLLALEGQLVEPLRFSIVGGDGSADDDATRALLRASNAMYVPHRLVDVQIPGAKYPDLGKPALFICTTTFCSPPLTDPATLRDKAQRYLTR
jgi:uncharacterized protein YyaL (SSP411 family)